MKTQKLSHLMNKLATSLAIALLVAYAPYTTAHIVGKQRANPGIATPTSSGDRPTESLGTRKAMPHALGSGKKSKGSK